MPLPRNKAWFRAMTYGWGWGLPLRWQGWLPAREEFLGLVRVLQCGCRRSGNCGMLLERRSSTMALGESQTIDTSNQTH
jgi:hypothetical protein